MKLLLFSLTLFISISIISCTTTLTLDQRQIRPWSKKISNEEPSQRSAIASCAKGPFALHYLAARHTNTMSDDTLRLVKTLFSDYNFNVVLIESIPHSSGESPKWFVDYAKRGLKDNFIMGGESALTAIYADQKQIPFYAGEPDHYDIYTGLKSKGYTDLDVIGFYTIRQIPQWVREKEAQAGLLKRKIPPYVADHCKIFHLATCPSYEDVLRWYELKNGHQLAVTISNEETAPLAEGQLFTQKISSDVNFIRDHFTLNIIQKLLKQHKRVAVVYGASHFVILRKSFESFFNTCTLRYAE